MFLAYFSHIFIGIYREILGKHNNPGTPPTSLVFSCVSYVFPIFSVNCKNQLKNRGQNPGQKPGQKPGQISDQNLDKTLANNLGLIGGLGPF